MNRLILIICCFITQNTISQNNFKVSNNNITWQKVFNTDSITDNQLIKFINTKPKIINVNYLDNQITAEIEGDEIDYKKYGGKTMSTLTILNHKLHAKVLIEIKQNKYRVTVQNITFIDDWSMNSLNAFADNTSTLKEYVLKKNGAIKQGKTIIKGLDYLNQHFIETFAFTKSNNDW